MVTTAEVAHIVLNHLAANGHSDLSCLAHLVELQHLCPKVVVGPTNRQTVPM